MKRRPRLCGRRFVDQVGLAGGTTCRVDVDLVWR